MSSDQLYGLWPCICGSPLIHEDSEPPFREWECGTAMWLEPVETPSGTEYLTCGAQSADCKAKATVADHPTGVK